MSVFKAYIYSILAVCFSSFGVLAVISGCQFGYSLTFGLWTNIMVYDELIICAVQSATVTIYCHILLIKHVLSSLAHMVI